MGAAWEKAVPNLLDRLETALTDRYTILQELGRCGMASVYLAEDLRRHRKVAIKVSVLGRSMIGRHRRSRPLGTRRFGFRTSLGCAT